MPASPSTMLMMLLLAAPALAGLEQDIEADLARAGLGTGQVSVTVRDCQHQAPLVDLAGDTPRIPASNMKLLSSGTAALVLGAEFAFRTQLLRRGDDLIVLGDGDPALGDHALLASMGDGGLTPRGLLNLWAAAVAESGMDRVNTLIVDDRVFDRELVHPTWPEKQLWKWYCAQISGLNFHRNVVHLRPRPAGRRVDVSDVRPRYPGISIDNDLKASTSKKARHVIGAARPVGSNTITLRGTVKTAVGTPIVVTVDDPAMHTGELLAQCLRRYGVTVDRVERAPTSAPPPSGTPIAPPIITPLATVLEVCNHDSLNLYAEALVKRTAHEATGNPGSWTHGNRIVTRTVETLAGDDSTFHAADGSGMSRDNRISTNQLSRFLCAMDRADPAAELFVESLPQRDEGTIARRFSTADLRGMTIRAKSGYLDGVWSLSGYLDSPGGRRLAFSVIVNKARGTASAKPVINAIVTSIAAHLADDAVADAR